MWSRFIAETGYLAAGARYSQVRFSGPDVSGLNRDWLARGHIVSETPAVCCMGEARGVATQTALHENGQLLRLPLCAANDGRSG